MTPGDREDAEWVTADDAARRLGMSKAFFQRFAQENAIETKGRGQSRRYRLTDVEAVPGYQQLKQALWSEVGTRVRANAPAFGVQTGEIGWVHRLGLGGYMGGITPKQVLKGVRLNCPKCLVAAMVVKRYKPYFGQPYTYESRCRNCGNHSLMSAGDLLAAMQAISPEEADSVIR